MSPRIVGYIIKIYNRVISCKILNSNIWFFEKCSNFLVHLMCNSKEIKASFGKENPDITFYVIRDPSRLAGLFSVHHFVVEHIKEALARDMIPIVDMQYYPNYNYIGGKDIGRVNWWEICFEQPFPYTLDEVYRSKNVILSSGIYDGQVSEIFCPEKILESHEIIKRYLRLNTEVEQMCRLEWERVKETSNKVLGVICRGTDYMGMRPHGHAIVPSVQMVIERIEELLQEWGERSGKTYDRIFVATEDEQILNDLKRYFKEFVVFHDCHRYTERGNKELAYINKHRDSEQKKRSLIDYLITIYCISQCDGLIGPRVNGTLGALRMKGKYDDLFIFQLGNYD